MEDVRGIVVSAASVEDGGHSIGCIMKEVIGRRTYRPSIDYLEEEISVEVTLFDYRFNLKEDGGSGGEDDFFLPRNE
jgi:hypothetical protein